MKRLSSAAVALALVAATAPPATIRPVAPVRDAHQYGEWIADVERPPEQYRRP